MLLFTENLWDALCMQMSYGGRPYVIITALAILSLLWARSWYRSSHASSAPQALQNSSTGRTKSLIPTPGEERYELRSALQVPVLISEIVPVRPLGPTETERDQILARCLDLEARISECNASNGLLRARLNSRDVKIGKLQSELMEIPAKEELVAQLGQKGKAIDALRRQLQTQKADHDSISNAHQEILKRLEATNKFHASTVEVIQRTYDVKLAMHQTQHEIEMQELKSRYTTKADGTSQRAARVTSPETQTPDRCKGLEAGAIEIRKAHAELEKRGEEREREVRKLLDENRLLRQRESELYNQVETLNGIVSTQDEDIEGLEKTIAGKEDHPAQIANLEHIDVLKRIIDTRAKEVDELKETIITRNESIEALKGVIDTQDEDTETLKKTIAENQVQQERTAYPKQIESLEKVIGNLRRIIAEKQDQPDQTANLEYIEVPREMVETRDEDIEALKDTINTQDGRIETLKKTIAPEQGQQKQTTSRKDVEALEEMVQSRNECIKQLEITISEIRYSQDQMVSTRDGYIRTLDGIIAGNNDQQAANLKSIENLKELVSNRDKSIKNLERTIAEKQDQEEETTNLARTAGRQEAAVAMKIHLDMVKDERTRTESKIKILQGEVNNKIEEISALKVAHAMALTEEIDKKTTEISNLQVVHAEALALAIQSRKDFPKTDYSFELNTTLNQLAECQGEAYMQVAEMVGLLLEKESHVRDISAGLEAEKKYSGDLEKKLGIAPRRTESAEENDPATKTVNQVKTTNGKKEEGCADEVEKLHAKPIDWSKASEGEATHQNGSTGSEGLSKKSQATKGAKQPPARIAPWLIGMISQIEEEKRKEAIGQVASTQDHPQRNDDGSGNSSREQSADERQAAHNTAQQGPPSQNYDSQRHQGPDHRRGRGRGGNDYRGRGRGRGRSRGRGTDNNRGNPGGDRGARNAGWTRG